MQSDLPGPSSQVARRVSSVVLDDFLREKGNPRVDLMKIDIDGGEPIALKGMKNFLQSAIDLKIIAEIFPLGLTTCGSSAIDYLNSWVELGYRAQLINKDGSLGDIDETITRPSNLSFTVNVLLSRSS
ncbi:MAG: FkbM family methyltransferase [Nitrospirota bacterium]